MVQRLKAFLLLGMLLITGVARSDVAPVKAQSDSAYQVIQLVNGFRENLGLPPFQINSALMAAAQNQANYMAANTVFSSHIGAGGSTPQSRANAAGYVGFVTENIVGGTGMTPSRGLRWWENSRVHYNTLVTNRYIEAGAGYSTNGTDYFYVLVVGRPSDAPLPNNIRDDSPEPLYITPIELSPPQADGSIVHIVQEGQALWSLAAHYEVSLNDLMLFNNMADDVLLHPGDAVTIRLADGQEPPPTPTPPSTHIVRKGDTSWTIAAIYGLKLSDFLWLNGLNENSLLQPGKEVIVRLAEGQAPPPTPTPITTHIVRSGQTLWDIALTYGLTLDDLLSYNDLSADSMLQIGQELRVRPLPSPSPPAPTPTPAQSTPIPEPSAVQVAAAVLETAVINTKTPTPQPLATSTDTNEQTSNSGNQTIAIGAAALAVGLTLLAGVFLIAGRQM